MSIHDGISASVPTQFIGGHSDGFGFGGLGGGGLLLGLLLGGRGGLFGRGGCEEKVVADNPCQRTIDVLQAIAETRAGVASATRATQDAVTASVASARDALQCGITSLAKEVCDVRVGIQDAKNTVVNTALTQAITQNQQFAQLTQAMTVGFAAVAKQLCDNETANLRDQLACSRDRNNHHEVSTAIVQQIGTALGPVLANLTSNRNNSNG